MGAVVAFRLGEYLLLFYLLLLIETEVRIPAQAVITICQPQSALLTIGVEFLVILFLGRFTQFVAWDVYF